MAVTTQATRIATVEINELNSACVQWDIVDEHGDPVPLGNVASFTVTLYDDLTNTIINSRDDQDILNANGGTYGTLDGHVGFDFSSDDNPILGTWQRGRRESHTALFELRWGPTGYWSGEVRLLVGNLTRVP